MIVPTLRVRMQFVTLCVTKGALPDSSGVAPATLKPARSLNP
ncbi:hypothetical protein JOE34_000615 [Pseudomonas sp. PvP028]|nr:hypothetical protein [Pseudomonas sp. PvP028]